MTGRAKFPAASPSELVNWGKLVAAATWTAKYPSEHKVLFKARKRTLGQNLPDGQMVVGSAFDRLCRLCNVWGSLSIRERQGRAGDLKAAAEACAAALTALGVTAGAEPFAAAPRRPGWWQEPGQ